MSDPIGDLNFDSVPETTLLVTPGDNAAVFENGDFVLEKLDHGRSATPRQGAAPGSDPNARTASGGRIGSFRISREIGRGGMGVVYEATEEILNRRVALKVLPLAALMDEQQIRRFRNEAAAAAQLIHPNIVPVYSVGSDRGVHFYAMQLIEGQNIAQVIGSIRDRLSSEQQKKQNPTPRAADTTQHSDESPGPMPKDGKAQSHASSGRHLMEDDFAAAVSGRRHPLHSQRLFKTVAALGRDAALAIGHAHDHGIIHRDIKPSNLLLDEKGKVWITDFGLAQIRDNPGETRTGDIVGTLRYMSPEQASGRKFLVDHRTDIYSLGITLYELLTLKQAFNGKGTKEILRQVAFEDPVALRQVNPRIPAELEVIISKAIGKNPQERYATATELADDLERFCNDQPIAAKRPSRLQKCRRWMVKHQTLSGMIGVGFGIVFLSSVAMSAVIWNSWQQEIAQRKQVTEQFIRSEAMRLIANALLVLPANPGQSLALGVEGAKHVSGLEVNKAVQAAMDANHELRVVFPRDAITHSIALDSRGRRIVSAVSTDLFGNGSFPAIVTDLRSGTESARLDSGGAVTSAVFSPHGEWILTASSGIRLHDVSEITPDRVGAPSLWDASTGRRLTTYSEHPLLEARAEMFAPDSSAVVLPGPENDATVYSTASHTRSFALRGHLQLVLQTAFSPDGSSIATADQHGEIRIWNSVDGTLLNTIPGSGRQRGSRLQFSVDSKFVILSGSDGTRVLPAGADVSTLPVFWREPVFVISAKHNRGASFWRSGDRITIRNLDSGDAICEISTQNPIQTAAFSPDGQQLAVANGPDVSVHDAATGRAMYELKGHTALVRSIEFDRTQDLIVTASDDATIRFWSRVSGASRQKYSAVADGRASASITFSPDSRFMLAASTTQSQTLLFDATGRRLGGATAGDILSDVFASGLLPVMTGTNVSIVDPQTSRVRSSRHFENTSVREVEWIPGSQKFIVLVDGSETLLWDRETDEVRPLTQGGDTAVSHAVAADHASFVLGTANGKCQLHEAQTGKRIRSIPHASAVSVVRFLPGGQRLLTVDERNTIRIWGESDEVPEMSVRKDGVVFTDCLISSDARSLLTYHQLEEQPVCCWDMATGELLRQTPGAEQLTVVAHPTSTALVLASRTQGISVWDYEADQLRLISKDPAAEVALLNDRIVAVQFPDGTDFQLNHLMWQPRTEQSSLRFYQFDSGETLASIAPNDGPFRIRLCTNAADQQVAVSTTVFSSTACELGGQRAETRVGIHTAPISFCGFLGDSGQIVTTSWDGSARIWSEDFQLRHTLIESQHPITAAVLSRDGRTLACGHADGTIVIWNTNTARQLMSLKAADATIRELALDPVGQNLLATETGGVVRFWNLLSREFSVESVDAPVVAARISPDGRFALMVPVYDPLPPDRDRARKATARRWDLTTGKAVAVSDSAGCLAAAFAHNSNRFVLVSAAGDAVVTDVAQDGTMSAVRTITSLTGPVRNVAFSPDDVLIATVSENGISLWASATGVEIHRIPAERTGMFVSGDSSLAEAWTPFSLDGHWIGRTGNETQVRAVFPARAAALVSERRLLPTEKQLFGVDQAGVLQPE